MAFVVKGSGVKGTAAHVSHEKAADYFRIAATYVKQSVKATTVFDAVNNLAANIVVLVNRAQVDEYVPTFDGGPIIRWDPLLSLKVTDDGWFSPAVALIHETYHCYQELVLKDMWEQEPQVNVKGYAGAVYQTYRTEVPTVVFESSVIDELRKLGHTNETKRTSYAKEKGVQDVKSPTATGT